MLPPTDYIGNSSAVLAAERINPEKMMKRNNMLEKDRNRNRKGMGDLLGIDWATSGVKVVRLRKIKGELSLVGADIYPAMPLSDPDSGEFSLPKTLLSNYAAVAYTGEEALIRVMQAPHAPEDKPDEMEPLLRKQLNVEEEYRAACYVIKQSKGKSDSTLLAVAVPKRDVSNLLTRFSVGAPAVYSFEVAGLAAFSGFMTLYRERHQEDSICLVEAGARVTILAFIVRGLPALVAKFMIGAESLNRRIENDLGVDSDMARTILAGGSVDISSSVDAVMSPFLRQLSVSRDFIERQNKTRVSNVYISGGLAKSAYWTDPIQDALGVACTSWDPLERIQVAPGAWAEKLEDQQHRFAAAIGAALGGLHEDG
jgi:Tfp pilus assembly PilM family ATPase